MNKEDIEKALRTRNDIYVPCSYCRALEGETAAEIMLRLAGCSNCLVDIRCKGEWSGSGMKALQRAFKKSPDNPNWPTVLKMFGLVTVKDEATCDATNATTNTKLDTKTEEQMVTQKDTKKGGSRGAKKL